MTLSECQTQKKNRRMLREARYSLIDCHRECCCPGSARQCLTSSRRGWQRGRPGGEPCSPIPSKYGDTLLYSGLAPKVIKEHKYLEPGRIPPAKRPRIVGCCSFGNPVAFCSHQLPWSKLVEVELRSIYTSYYILKTSRPHTAVNLLPTI